MKKTVLFSLSALLLLIFCQTKGQSLISPYFRTARYTNFNFGIKGSFYSKNKMSGWVCGDYSSIKYTLDGGKTWASSNLTMADAYLNSIYFLADNKTGWAAGNNGIILKSVDGGKSWSNLKHDATYDNIKAVYFSDDQQYGLVTTEKEIIQTFDGGKNWKKYSMSIEQNSLLNIQFLNRKEGIILANTGLLVTHNQGKSWTDLTAGKVNDQIQALDKYDFSAITIIGDRYLIGTDDGNIVSMSFDTRTIKLINTPSSSIIHNFSFINDRDGIMASDTTYLCSTSDGGSTWQKEPSLTKINLGLYHVNFINKQSLSVFLSQRGRRLYTDDGGKSWKGDTLQKTAFIKLFKATGKLYGCSNGYFGNFSMHAPFYHQLEPDPGYLESCFTNTAGVWITSNTGNLYHAPDLVRFSKIKISSHPLLKIIMDKSGQQGASITHDGDLFYTDHSWQKFKTKKFSAVDSLNDLTSNDDFSRFFLVGDNAMLWTAHSLAGDWTPNQLIKNSKNIDFKKIIFNKPSTLGFILARPQKEHGVIDVKPEFLLRTTDKGKNWDTVTFAKNYEFTNLIYGKNALWLLTADGNVLQSLDQGLHWFNIVPRFAYYSLNDLLDTDDEVIIGGDNGLIKHFQKSVKTFTLHNFMLKPNNQHQVPKLEIDLNNLSPENLVVSIEVISKKDHGLTRCFNYSDIKNINWNDLELENNTSYTFLVKVSDGINIQQKVVSLVIGKTLWASFKTLVYWDRWPKDVKTWSAFIAAQLSLLTVLYIIIIVLLYIIYPFGFVLLHEQIASKKLPLPSESSKYFFLFLIDTERCLEAYVNYYSEQFWQGFKTAPDVNERLKWVPAPFKINSQQITFFNRYAPDYHPGLDEIKNQLEENGRTMFLLQGQGGSGKTTLAIQLCLWASNTNARERLFKKTALPVFINNLNTNLDDEIRNQVLYLTGSAEISDVLIRGLARKKRIIACVDGLSEMNDLKVDYITPELGGKNSFLVVYTSRKPLVIRNLINIVPLTLNLDFVDYLLDGFIENYAGANKFGAEREVIRERVLIFIKQAQIADQQLPALILKTIVIEASTLLDSGKSLAGNLPYSIFSLFNSYLKGLLHDRKDIQQVIRDLRSIALLSLGLYDVIHQTNVVTLADFKEITPRWVSLNILEKLQLGSNLDLFFNCGLLTTAGDSNDQLFKFMYDSLAEYLSADEIIIRFRDNLLPNMFVNELSRLPNKSFTSKILEIAQEKSVSIIFE